MMQPHGQLAPQRCEPAESRSPRQLLTFLSVELPTQARPGQGHGGAEARHLGFHHEL